jgi:hypothetical protein
MPLMLCSLTLTLAAGTACFPWLPAPESNDGGDGGEQDGSVVTTDGGVTDAAGVDASTEVVDAGPLTFSPDASGVVGPAGGRVGSVAQAQDGQVVYAVGGEHGGLFRSTTQGGSFVAVSLPQALAEPVVGTSYGSTDVVLVADALGQGAWVHTARGEDVSLWTAVTSLSAVSVQRFVPSALMPGRVYALVKGGGAAVDGGTAAGSLWVSDNNGLTFSSVGLPGETTLDVWWDGAHHIVATDRGLQQVTTSPGGVLTLSPEAVNSVVADPTVAGNFLTANAAGRVFRVTYSGLSGPLQSLGLPVPPGGLQVQGSNVYVLAGSVVYRSVTSAATDAGPGVLSGFLAAGSVASDARLTGGVVLQGASPSLLVSTAGGGVVTFSITAAGLSTGIPSTGVAAHRCPGVLAQADLVLVGCVVEGASFQTARVWSGPSVTVLGALDLGTGEAIPTPGGPVAVSRGPDGTAYAATGTLHKSVAGGTWQATAVTGVFSVDAQPTSGSSKVVLGVRRADGIPQVQLSPDQGATSSAVPGTLGVMPWQVAFSRADSVHALLVSLPETEWQGFTPLSLERGLFETVDGFATLVHGGPTLVGDSVSAVVLPSSDSAQAWVMTAGGRVYKRTTWDGTWAAGGMVTGLTVMSMTEIPGRPGALVVAGIPSVEGGAALALSVDSGATWTALSAVSVPAALRVVADPSGTDRLLVGTVGQGVWVVKP